jgi:hypothetical protein
VKRAGNYRFAPEPVRVSLAKLGICWSQLAKPAEEAKIMKSLGKQGLF